jgi:hypothetical protein
MLNDAGISGAVGGLEIAMESVSGAGRWGHDSHALATKRPMQLRIVVDRNEGGEQGEKIKKKNNGNVDRGRKIV